MIRSRWRSFGLLVSALTLLLVGLGREAQTRPRGDDVRVPTAAAAGEESKVSAVNDWTVGVAGGFFEGTFIRFAVELAKALEDGDKLRVLPTVSYGGTENGKHPLSLNGTDRDITDTGHFDPQQQPGR